MTDKQFAVECADDRASTILGWILNRGGIAVYKSINLANPCGQWIVPVKDANGNPTGKPSWECGNDPVVITDPAQVGVYDQHLFKEIPVKLRLGANGFMLKLTDGSQRKVDRALAACEKKHGNAHYRKGDMLEPSIIVYYSSGVTPLSERK